MHNKTTIYFVLVFCIWNTLHRVQANFEPEYTLESNEFATCDYSRFESRLESLKTDNEFFKLRFEMIKSQLDEQNEILHRLEQKFDRIPQSLQNIESKMLDKIQENFIETNDLISRQKQMLHIDNKFHMISDINEMVKNQDVRFETFTEKLTNMENILNKASWETSTRKLGDSIFKNLTLLQNIDKKLTNVNTIAIDQIDLYRNIQQYLNESEATRICLLPEEQTLVCTNQTYPTSCADSNTFHCAKNKCRIHNHLYGPQPFWVSCDIHTEGGGWTVIQRRINGSIDFYRDWSEYKNGFGNIDGEFFIGLDKLHALTNTLQPMELLIQLKDFTDTLKYANYDAFIVGNETENYKLNKVGKYFGNAGDSLSQHQGYNFTTRDRDNDVSATYNCAFLFKGAWWYEKCFWSNLNGIYYDNEELAKSNYGICWSSRISCEYTFKYVQMMIRPKKSI